MATAIAQQDNWHSSKNPTAIPPKNQCVFHWESEVPRCWFHSSQGLYWEFLIKTSCLTPKIHMANAVTTHSNIQAIIIHLHSHPHQVLLQIELYDQDMRILLPTWHINYDFSIKVYTCNLNILNCLNLQLINKFKMNLVAIP